MWPPCGFSGGGPSGLSGGGNLGRSLRRGLVLASGDGLGAVAGPGWLVCRSILTRSSGGLMLTRRGSCTETATDVPVRSLHTGAGTGSIG